MADFRMPPLNGGERLYRALLHIYPTRFRRAFKQDLIETFRDQQNGSRPSEGHSCTIEIMRTL